MIIQNSLMHIVERFVFVLQRVTVDNIVQVFDTLINVYGEEIRIMSVPILEVLINAFETYKKDNEDDNAMFTAMSTMECISSILMNACEDVNLFDKVAMMVLPTMLVCYLFIYLFKFIFIL